jgi:hypothetical protein
MSKQGRVGAGTSEAVESAVALPEAERAAVEEGASGTMPEMAVAVAGFVAAETIKGVLGIVRWIRFGFAVALEAAEQGVDARALAGQSVRDAVRLDGCQCKVAFAEASKRFQNGAL